MTIENTHTLPAGWSAWFRAGAIGGLLLALAGCASYGGAYIQSVPPGAEVVNLEDDSLLGRTPVKVWWKGADGEAKQVHVRFQKPGYRDRITSFWVNVRHASKENALAEAQPVNVELERSKGEPK